METKEKNKEKGKTLFFLVLPILIGSIFCNIWLLSNRHKLISQQEKALLLADSSLSAKLQVEKQFNEVQGELNDSRQVNDGLYSTVAKLKGELAKSKGNIEKLSKENSTVRLLNKQIKDFKNRVEDYEKQKNAVLQEKGDLEIKLVELNKILVDIKKDNEELKKKLEWAKDLKTYELNVINYKTVRGKQKLTMRAKKVHRISVSFMLAENLVAELGTKVIYVVIYDPKKKVLTTTNEKFINKKTNTEQIYSIVKIIDFKNTEQKVNIDYDTESKLIKGKYKVEVYADGNLSTKKEFELH
jgi:hypothetical protein